MNDFILFPLLTGDKVGDVIKTLNHLSHRRRRRVIWLLFWRPAHVTACIVYSYNISRFKCFDLGLIVVPLTSSLSCCLQMWSDQFWSLVETVYYSCRITEQRRSQHKATSLQLGSAMILQCSHMVQYRQTTLNNGNSNLVLVLCHVGCPFPALYVNCTGIPRMLFTVWSIKSLYMYSKQSTLF